MLNDVVAIFCEFREQDPSTRQWRGQTRILLQRGTMAPEAFWIEETIPQVLSALGIVNGNFVDVHMPLGTTAPRTIGQWEDELEGPSMELAPLLVNREAISHIGPSPVVHYRRRELGRIYTRDGSAFDLYESLDTLRILVGPEVPEIPHVEPLGPS